MKNYIFNRLIRSIISIFAVTSIAIVMVFVMIPKEKVFLNDPTKNKIMGDQLTAYKYAKWEDLGYLDFLEAKDICAKSENYEACIAQKGDYSQRITDLENDGYTVEYYESGSVFAYYEYSPFELIANFLKNLVVIDHPGVVQDVNNPDLERKYYVQKGPNGLPTVSCTGCKYEYQLYVDSNFPFIHQNAVKLHFGNSFPTFSGIDTLEVITNGQGSTVSEEVTFPTGVTQTSPLNLYSCQYKPTSTLDHLDATRFDDNYANCKSNYDSSSMTGLSYLFGILSLILAYAIAIPAGVKMAQKKDQWQDKLGIVYINIMISVPSLAFIYFTKQIGLGLGFPDKFPQYGFGDIRSYVLPIVILGLMSTSSLMIWIRRYMIDQSNSDYVKFARAKGLSQKEIFNHHILKNAIIPIVNGIPSSVILCISGAVITETVFAIPGMGKMLPDAIHAFNNTMVVTLTFIFTTLSVLSLLLGDILMTLVDPRIQLSSKGDSR